MMIEAREKNDALDEDSVVLMYTRSAHRGAWYEPHKTTISAY